MAIYVECPRDAWQGLPGVVPTERKREHLHRLLGAGFRRLDLGSFVSPRAVPQMADTEALLAGLERPPDADFLCIVANERGLERALACRPTVSSVGFPLSLSDTFQRRNTRRSLADAWPLVGDLVGRCADAGLGLVVYLSMGFGNPYGDPWTPRTTAEAVTRLRRAGVQRIALADTVGGADADAVRAVLEAVDEPERTGLHLHARPDRWRGAVEAGLDAGVGWFEGALSGIGGCPFAGDGLVGNLPTERVVPFLLERGLDLAVDAAALPGLAADALDAAAKARAADGTGDGAGEGLEPSGGAGAARA